MLSNFIFLLTNSTNYASDLSVLIFAKDLLPTYYLHRIGNVRPMSTSRKDASPTKMIKYFEKKLIISKQTAEKQPN